MFNRRLAPYERAEIASNTYNDFLFRRSFVVPAQALVKKFVDTFKEFSASVKGPPSFSVDQIMEQLEKPLRTADLTSAVYAGICRRAGANRLASEADICER